MLGWLILCAFALDLLLAEPRRIPHPVVGIGRLIERLELALAVMRNRRRAGIILVVLTLLITGLVTWGLLALFEAMHPLLGFLLGVWIAFTTLALRSLHKESREVVRWVQKGNLGEARRSLSLIVGRETRTLDEEGIIKACIETVAENTSDGLVAPLFYLFIGGPILAILYKAVNTLDSMVGYLTDRYRELGWAAAKMDDLANWIPARLTAFLMVLAAFPLGLNGFNALRIALRDARKHRSPNAGWPEAAVAGALGIQLGGPAVYFGECVEKVTLGDADKPITVACYHRMIRLMYLTAFLALGLGLAVLGLIF
ncbi:adenosylcobinamide-phosphate synthase CbiB [Geoalkalibacter halelectricus]|uniref:Cobalamin biosynthesis protein CobD n=1 Tax=Geoalkalibacter halelectricus TaxID=2847045 RepID=A0ABY5ZS00_9BACT|nr:adenosylcobinamide-phosphate synthase CbiB [Geoalkalibacter halelectricus]MDO3377534.1 adenosylcobinamide-phosphate synthase CbiB [Geoalkalibacter halelectricus]UWZ80707.1 adenosylcobinamide-phosphate synthase CbiB [Geoalkalibacter halelectricus]